MSPLDATVGCLCSYEGIVLLGRPFCPLLRRLPTVTRLCGRHPFRCAVVLGGIAVHFATARS
jgi:hypothetical protein